MNVFRTSEDPEECAGVLCDQHVIKMATESGQILATALRLAGVEAPGLWKATHSKHPCVVWAGQSQENFSWLLQHGRALCAEYGRRFGRTHGAQAQLGLLEGFAAVLPDSPSTPSPHCVPEDLKNTSLHEAYRETLRRKYSTWKRPPRWTESAQPSWLVVSLAKASP